MTGTAVFNEFLLKNPANMGDCFLRINSLNSDEGTVTCYVDIVELQYKQEVLSKYILYNQKIKK